MTGAARHEPDDDADLCLLPFDEPGRPELYYIHDISGSVVSFTRVAAALADCRSVIGVQAVGLDGDIAPDETIAAMADRYFRAVTGQHTGGPYDLVGYSMGALIAFELAQRLSRSGETVRLLGLLDPPVPGTLGSVDAGRVLRMIARNLGLPKPADATVGEKLAVVLAGAKAAGAVPPGYRAADLRAIVDLQLVHGRAASDYLPADTYAGAVRLLCAGVGQAAERAAGWRPFADGPVVAEDVDADHISLLRGAPAAVTAAVLRRWLSEPGGPAPAR